MKLDEDRGNSVIRLGASDDSVVFVADKGSMVPAQKPLEL